MLDTQCFTPRCADRRTSARRNEELYGVADIDAIADAVTLRLENENSLPLMTIAMLSEAQEEILQDPARAVRTLNRIKFLILRCCPMNPNGEAASGDAPADAPLDHAA